jgi:hypothetical protein
MIILKSIYNKSMRFILDVCDEWRVFNPIMKFPEGKRPLDRTRRGWEDNINLLAPEFYV